MTDTLVREDTAVINLTEDTTDQDPNHCAHIVKTEPGESAAGKVLEARIYGYQVEALCGHRWIPSKDPKQLNICSKCKEIYDLINLHNDGSLNEVPDA